MRPSSPWHVVRARPSLVGLAGLQSLPDRIPFAHQTARILAGQLHFDKVRILIVRRAKAILSGMSCRPITTLASRRVTQLPRHSLLNKCPIRPRPTGSWPLARMIRPL
jgi:hypothetical protein